MNGSLHLILFWVYTSIIFYTMNISSSLITENIYLKFKTQVIVTRCVNEVWLNFIVCQIIAWTTCCKLWCLEFLYLDQVVYLFTCSLLNVAVTSSDYIALKNQVFWDVTQHCWSYCMDCLTLKVKTLRSFETWGAITTVTWHNISEYSSLQQSHVFFDGQNNWREKYVSLTGHVFYCM